MRLELLAWVVLFASMALALQEQTRQKLFAVSHRIVPRPGCTLTLFSLFMLPGTLVHEGSHVVAALFMGSSVSNVSLRPRYDQDGVELGSMIAKDVGPVRNSIISVAPFLIGSLLVLLVGWHVFDFPGAAGAVEAGQWDEARQSLTSPFGTVLGWIGAYLILIVSINMLPSTQDLKSGAGIFMLVVVIGAVLWMVLLTRGENPSGAAQVTNAVLIWLGLALAFVVILSIPVLLLLALLTF